MSMCRAMVGVLLILAALGVCREVGWAQTVGGDVVGSVFAAELTDLDALNSCLNARELRVCLDPLLAAGASISELSFSLLSELPDGDKIYLGSLTAGTMQWSFVHYVPSATGLSPVTYVRAGVAGPVAHVQGSVVPDSPGLALIDAVFSNAPPSIQQVCLNEFAADKVTGIRVTRSGVAQRVTHYRLELFFGGERAPRLVVGADCTAGVLSNLAVE